jgi:coatomer subunit alpha
MRGHTNNVSCVLFHPKHELIVSNSEDRTIRVWDISKRLGVQTFRRESDRFWILAAHPEQNLLAAGHDSGMIVFKLERERPAFDSVQGRCYYIKERYLRSYEYSNARDVPIVSLRRANTANTVGVGGGPRSLQYNMLNKTEHNVLITSDTEGGSYELINFSLESTNTNDAQDVRRGLAISTCFVARDRFAMLDKTKQLLVKNFQNEVVRKVVVPTPGVEQVFFAGTAGRVLLKTEDRVILFDYQARKVLSELFVSRVKYVFWNADCTNVALISKHQLTLANKQLEHASSVNETLRLKGGCWDESGQIFVYTTANHVKYLLLNGDKGIIRGLEVPMYPVKLVGINLFCLDREGKMRTLELELAEPLFKLALENKDYSTVMKMVKQSRLCGQSIISYLQAKGYPEVALHFVHDARTRFKLALACGSIQVALSVANDLDDQAWIQLGAQALKQGQFEVVEMAYQKTKQLDQLSFLYLITGNIEKLRKMLKIAEMRQDVMSVVHNALYLGEAENRMKIFEATGQQALAYLLAKTHQLQLSNPGVEMEELDSKYDQSFRSDNVLLLPPTPILRAGDWPLLMVSGANKGAASVSTSGNGGASTSATSRMILEEEEDGDAGDGPGKDGWDDNSLFDDEEDSKPKAKAESTNGKSKSAWEEDDDLDLSDDDQEPSNGKGPASPSKGASKAGEMEFSLPPSGTLPHISWTEESTHCADHFAAGSAESALRLLNRQIAATNVTRLKPTAASLFIGSRAYLRSVTGGKARRVYLTRSNPAGGSKTLPSLTLKPKLLLEKMKGAHRAFTGAQFGECEELLLKILDSVPLTLATNKTESDDLKELLYLAKEYLLAVRIKSAMDKEANSSNIPRSLELAAYFTHCNLQASHLILALKTAMANAFKNKVNKLSYFDQ